MSEADWRKWVRARVQSSTPFLWVLEGKLACAPRPLRYDAQFGGRLPAIPVEATGPLSAWLADLSREGIGTITCLATPGELRRYGAIVGEHPDLITLYMARGFVVHHHPIQDPAHAPPDARVGILEQLDNLKPVVLCEYTNRTQALLVHCSGGMDRAAPIVAFIASKEVGSCPRDRPEVPTQGPAG